MRNHLFTVSLEEILAQKKHHSKNSLWYKNFSSKLNSDLQRAREKGSLNNTFTLEEIGEVVFPFYSFGKVDSLNLLNLDELITFSIYWSRKNLDRKVYDFGANIGLHSIVLAKMGHTVTAFEPDPIHAQVLLNNISLNNLGEKVILEEKAIGAETGQDFFTRIKNNTTGSHISGSKDIISGPTDSFKVEIVGINSLLDQPSFSKMDVEGLEAKILQAISFSSWGSTSILVEVGNKLNAKAIWDVSTKHNLKVQSQLSNWSAVRDESEIPSHYSDGLLFITGGDGEVWGQI
jgi:FkbM family methyltransferase